jgi:hypothetical protein
MIESSWETPQILIYADKDKYKNQSDNKQRKREVLYLASGTVYDCLWDGDYSYGEGCAYYFTNDKYDGEFKNGVRHGNGTYHYYNGAVYEGEWEEGLCSGF